MLNREQIRERWIKQSEMIKEELQKIVGDRIELSLYPASFENGSESPVSSRKMTFSGVVEKVEIGGSDDRPTTTLVFEGGSKMSLDNYQTIWTISDEIDRLGGSLVAKDVADQCLDWKSGLGMVVEINRC